MGDGAAAGAAAAPAAADGRAAAAEAVEEDVRGAADAEAADPLPVPRMCADSALGMLVMASDGSPNRARMALSHRMFLPSFRP
jgi:hypothetical protein